MNYEEYIARKSAITMAKPCPIDGDIAPHLFDFQNLLVKWALAKGRAAIFADTGLGKTAMQLEWARHVSSEGRVLLLSPLAVAEQTVDEGERFGVDLAYRREDAGDRITITNYEMLDRFDPSNFVGVVLDESSILKSFTGATRTALIESFSETPWRLACTATPAPNDFTELGNHSEFLGVQSRVEMLAEYFVHDGGSTQDWRVKGHAVKPFWEWVCSWGAVVRMPSDIGCSDERHTLLPLRMHSVPIEVEHRKAWDEGALFQDTARTLNDQRRTRKATLAPRVEAIANLAKEPGPLLVWCEYNAEGDAIEKAIPDAVQISGSDSPQVKRDRLLGFSRGDIRVLVTKPSIAGFGMNWQHCSRMAFVGPSHSYEQTYQGIRRCWRFGQNKPVDVYVCAAQTEQAVVSNYFRKARAAQEMGDSINDLGDIVRANVTATARNWNPYAPEVRMRVPDWVVPDGHLLPTHTNDYRGKAWTY